MLGKGTGNTVSGATSKQETCTFGRVTQTGYNLSSRHGVGESRLVDSLLAETPWDVTDADVSSPRFTGREIPR